MHVCERAERASLENFGIFTFLNWYFFQYFVGTSDILSVQMVCLSDNMYRQISKCTDKTLKKHYGGDLPPPPSGYASDTDTTLFMTSYTDQETRNLRTF